MKVQYEITRRGTLRASYDVFVPGPDGITVNEDARLCFHLTDEGLIVDLFDDDGNCIGTFASTPEEFLPFILGD